MAYHTVATMVEILEQYQLLHHHPDLDFKNQIQSIIEKSRTYIENVWDWALRIEAGMEWETRIIDVAHKIEDVIETHIRNQILQLPPDTDNEVVVNSQLIKLVQEFQSIMEEPSETVDVDEDEPMLPLDHLSSNSVPWYPKLDPRSRDDLTCIFEHDFQTLKAQLIQQAQTIPNPLKRNPSHRLKMGFQTNPAFAFPGNTTTTPAASSTPMSAFTMPCDASGLLFSNSSASSNTTGISSFVGSTTSSKTRSGFSFGPTTRVSADASMKKPNGLLGSTSGSSLFSIPNVAGFSFSNSSTTTTFSMPAPAASTTGISSFFGSTSSTMGSGFSFGQTTRASTGASLMKPTGLFGTNSSPSLFSVPNVAGFSFSNSSTTNAFPMPTPSSSTTTGISLFAGSTSSRIGSGFSFGPTAHASADASLKKPTGLFGTTSGPSLFSIPNVAGFSFSNSSTTTAFPMPAPAPADSSATTGISSFFGSTSSTIGSGFSFGHTTRASTGVSLTKPTGLFGTDSGPSLFSIPNVAGFSFSNSSTTTTSPIPPSAASSTITGISSFFGSTSSTIGSGFSFGQTTRASTCTSPTKPTGLFGATSGPSSFSTPYVASGFSFSNISTTTALSMLTPASSTTTGISSFLGCITSSATGTEFFSGPTTGTSQNKPTGFFGSTSGSSLSSSATTSSVSAGPIASVAVAPCMSHTGFGSTHVSSGNTSSFMTSHRKPLHSRLQHELDAMQASMGCSTTKLRIIAIDGAFGMGKRTLARRLFNDPIIASQFRTRAWVTSPFENDEKGCLQNLLEGLGMLTHEMSQKNVNELKAYIRNALKYIKYFIVIHDVVDDGNLVTFASLFRDYRVGARVLLTTFDIGMEELDLSTYAEPYKMPLMSNTESWLLLRQKVFGREHFPHELELVGKKVVQLCKGSPLTVSLIAGVLATSEKTTSVWERVAKTLLEEANDDVYFVKDGLFSLIYLHLPHYLRPCLLYTGAFYESRDIKASKIIKLWIAEGFVTQIRGKCLEDVAATYLQILINKNLYYHTSEEPNGRVRAFQPHLSLRMSYWILAIFEQFLGSKYLHEMFDDGEEKFARRVSIHRLYQPCDEMELPLNARSFLSVSGASGPKFSIYLKLRLLRVLEVFQLEFYQFPVEIMQQVLLRYLAFSCHSYISNSFSIFRYLQTVIIQRLPAFRAFSLPSDLWGLTQLRHVKCKKSFIMIYPKNGEKVVHGNLQTLSNMQIVGVTNQFLQQIPNIRNLGIFCNIAMDNAFDLACLDKLETLKCSSDWSLASRNFLAYLTLPQSMRKLNLSLCRIPSKFMGVIGSLPNLELLKLQKSDIICASSSKSEPEWKTAEGEFRRLVSLEMLDLNLVLWKAKATHLPELRHLVIRNCYAMAEIPSDIGNITTLELIQVNETSPAALVSAMQIRKEQEGRGNKILQVRTHKVV